MDTEPKTSTAISLALALSGASASGVLIIDADTHQPSVHELLGISNDNPVSDVAREEGRAMPIVQVSPLLHMLSVDRSIPGVSELTALAVRSLVEQCAARYDWVLLNGPAMSFGPSRTLSRA